MRRGFNRTAIRLGAEHLEDRLYLAAAQSAIIRFEGGQPSWDAQQVMTSLEAYVSRTWLDGQLTQVTFGEDIEIANAIERFRALPEVEYAIVDSLFSLAEVIPNDPHFEDQWPLKNDVGPDINATFAWDQTVGQSTTLVAVLDSGVDFTHPDLYLAIAVNQDEIPPAFAGSLIDTNGDGLIDFYDLNSLDAFGQLVVDGSGAKYNASLVTDANGNSYIDAGDLMLAPWSDGVDGDGNGLIDDLTGWDHITNTKNPTDSTGHGTHVTGIIAARGNNSEGIAGVNWNARILPEKVVKDGVVKTSDAIDAIQRAVAAGANVINASWGSYIYDPALRDAIEWAGLHGVVFVAAAGNHLNDNDNPAHAYYPASYDLSNVISVASSDPNGNISDFSNFGDNTVDLVAPGSNVLSTWLGGGYVTHSGTSMAAPHVAGVVSLLGGLFPDASTAWLVDRVLSTVDLLPGLSAVTITGGILDAFVAVNTTSVAGPRVVASEPTGDVVSEAHHVVIRFDRPMDVNTFTPDDVEVTGPSGPIAVTSINWLNDFEFEVTFVPQIALGVYSLRLGPSISDQVGRQMDQDRDGLSGELIDDRYATTFRIIPPPQVQTIDSGEAGFSATGGWVNYNGAGLDGDVHFIQAGNGSETATWSFTGLAPGKYRIAVTWEEYSNRVSDAAYTVRDDFAELATLVVDQRQAPGSFFADGVWWQNVSGEFDILGGILSVELTNLAAPADGYLIADAVRVERVGDASLPSGPEVRVLEGAASISDETGTVDFGRADIGTPLSRTFTVRNAGAQNLTLGTISLPAGFSLAADFTTTTLASGQQTTFTVRLDAAAAGVFGGQISFATNDDDENPFNFTVQGTVSVLLTIDSGEAGFSATGGWVNYNGAGLDGDVHFIQAGNGSETATWSFTGLAPGKYRIAVTWEEYSNRVSDAAYTVRDDFAELATLVVDQRQAPGSFFADGVWWQNVSGEFDILGGILSVELTNLAAPADGYLIADAVRVERVGDASLPSGPEVRVLEGAASISDETGTVDFGRADIGTPLSRTFTVRNAGAQNLTLGTISLPAGFSLAADFTTTTLASGQQTTFTVRLDAAAAGVFGGQISFATNDDDENPFNFTVQGTVSVLLTIDSGEAGFSATGGWVNYNGAGLDGDVHFIQAGNGSETATWSFTGLAPGKYRIAVTWEEYSNRVSDAAYTVRDDFAELATLVVDQRQAPGSFFADGVWWQNVSGEFDILGGILSVELTNLAAPADGYLIADAVRVERVGDASLPSGPEVRVLEGAASISDETGTVDFGRADIGTPLSRTFTVRNAGAQNLTLGTISLPAGFSLAADFTTTTLASGQQTTFTVRLDAAAAGVFGGQISFATNDDDENPFNFTVQGTVSVLLTIDSGEAGFSATGGWVNYNGAGLDGDVHFIQAGNGSETATWSFTGLAPGKYRIAVTWEEYSNRVSDAAYTVRDDFAELATLVVDQRQAPGSFFADGVWWQNVSGEFDILGGILSVELTNLAAPADGYLIADAVRVERVGDARPT